MPERTYADILQEKRARDAASLDQFTREVRELQDACPHERVTRWLRGTNYAARLCVRCHKEMDREECATICGEG